MSGQEVDVGPQVGGLRRRMSSTTTIAEEVGRQSPAPRSSTTTIAEEVGRQAASASALSGLHDELRASLERMEVLQRQWGNPLAESSALRRALRAELQRADSPREGGPPTVAPPSSPAPELPAPPSPPRSPSPRAWERATSWPSRPSLRSEASGRLSPPSEVRGSLDISEPSSPGKKSVSALTRAASSINWRSPLAAYGPTTPAPEFSGPMNDVRWALWRLLHQHGTAFDSVVGLVIFASSVNVGVEIQCDLQGSTACVRHARNLENFFLVIFVLELCVRVLADGLYVLQSGWFRFDLSLVVMGVFFKFVEHILRNTEDTDGDLWLDIFSKVLILRILRLTRLIRALRLFHQFQEMWKLANGLVRSLRTVMSACVMILLTIYVFACLGIELVARNPFLLQDPETAELIQENFPSLPVTMLTLIQFANADSIASVYRPFVEKEWWLVFFFGSVWLVVTIKLMNLITAVIVDNAITQGDADREIELEMKRKKLRGLRPVIQKVFNEIDRPAAGTITLKQFQSGLADIQADRRKMENLPADLRNILLSDQIVEVFYYLDADRSGAIDESEFVDGAFSLMLQSVPIETTQMLQLLRSHSDALKKIEGRIMQLPNQRQLSHLSRLRTRSRTVPS